MLLRDHEEVRKYYRGYRIREIVLDVFDNWNLETSETTNSSSINTPETTVENTATKATDASTKGLSPIV